MTVQRPRGTRDVFPPEVERFQWLEQQAREVCRLFGYGEIRFPTFEFTELFTRGVGDTTDVVQKEMYELADRDGRGLCLRPEGTASSVRAFLENGLYGGAMPASYFYLVPCFRYEKPQAGRLREFHQFGVEVFGAKEPEADAEVISLARAFLARLGLKRVSLRLNSIGCKTCRADYHRALRDFFEPKSDKLCATCTERLLKNPMRLLDCKSPVCGEMAQGAPCVLDHLCEECDSHFEAVKGHLNAMGIDYEVDGGIVRGLDYYTKTVFEFVTDEIGAQGTVCGGGRYDGLIETLGGKPTPGLGFAMGIERLLLLLEAQGAEVPKEAPCDLYLAPMDQEGRGFCLALAERLRAGGIAVQSDLMRRSLKAQMKYADKLGARYCLVLGQSERETGTAMLKRMEDGQQTAVSLTSTAQEFCALLKGE